MIIARNNRCNILFCQGKCQEKSIFTESSKRTLPTEMTARFEKCIEIWNAQAVVPPSPQWRIHPNPWRPRGRGGANFKMFEDQKKKKNCSLPPPPPGSAPASPHPSTTHHHPPHPSSQSFSESSFTIGNIRQQRQWYTFITFVYLFSVVSCLSMIYTGMLHFLLKIKSYQIS